MSGVSAQGILIKNGCHRFCGSTDVIALSDDIRKRWGIH